MENKNETKIEVIKCKVPKVCICPSCGMEQKPKLYDKYTKKVKTLNIDSPKILVLERKRVFCKNPVCKRKTFVLPTPGIEKYQRVTNRVKEEAIDKNVLDNIPYEKTSASLKRLNTSGSKSSIHRWKQKEADKYNFREIIAKLDFSGVLSIDEYKPKRAKHYDLIAADAVKWHILYLETVSHSPTRKGGIPRGSVKEFCERLKNLGIEPWAIIFDLMAAYPKQVRKTWPGINIQYDYFHIMQVIHKHLKNALLSFRRSLVGEEMAHYRGELWENRWRLLRNMENWTEKDHGIINELLQVYTGTMVEKVLMFKEAADTIFNKSESKDEAYRARDSLYREAWWIDSSHLVKAMEFLMSNRFEYMVTYLADTNVSRSGNIENMIREWRIAENVRFGFKTEKGRQSHLKLYQIKKYLGVSFPKFGKAV